MEAGGIGIDRCKPKDLTRALRASGASGRGRAGAFRGEAAFRPELAFAVPVTLLALWLGRDGVERALLIAPVLLILIVKLINDAVAASIDRIGLEQRALAGLAENIGSAAVLMSFGLLGVVWLLVLLSR